MANDIEPMTMRWFGQPWPDAAHPGPVCADVKYHVHTPVGQNCTVCDEPIHPTDSGVIVPHVPTCKTDSQPCHRRCLYRLFGLDEPHDTGYGGAL